MILTKWYEKRKKEKQRKLKIQTAKKYLLELQLEVLVDYSEVYFFLLNLVKKLEKILLTHQKRLQTILKKKL